MTASESEHAHPSIADLPQSPQPLVLYCCHAGVTTGPVTVPFVLSIGIGFSKAVGAPEGFGMLTVMSVAPIISVLLVSILKQPVKQATQTLVRVSKIPLQRISRPLRSGGDRCVCRT